MHRNSKPPTVLRKCQVQLKMLAHKEQQARDLSVKLKEKVIFVLFVC